MAVTLSFDEVAAQTEQSAGLFLEEIVVTATKRERALRDIPVAVSAYSDTQLKYAGIHDIRELTAIAPSLFLSNSQSEAAGSVARIRGIGTTGDNAGLESSVGVFIDGVYRNRNNVGLAELGEIERIEVLRGPQGTLFGRNTSAGLINIITKGPDYKPSGYARVSYGNHDNIRVEGGVNSGLVKNLLAGRVDAVFSKRDGFVDDIDTGRDYNDRDRVLIRGQLLWEPNDSSRVRLIADYSDRQEQCCAAVTLVPGPTQALIEALGGMLTGDPFDRKASVNADQGYQEDVEEWGVSAEVGWDTRFGTITSITAYRDWQVARSQDIDFTNVDILFRDQNGFVQGFETLTQEVRFQRESEMADWLVGFYYSNEDLSLKDSIRTGADFERYINGLVSGNPFSGFYSQFTGLAPGNVFLKGDGTSRDDFLQESESWAAFTHNTVNLTSNFALTAGLRYTEETKDLDATLLSNNRACTSSFVANVQRAATMGLVSAASVPTIIGLPCLPFFNPYYDGVYGGSRKETKWSGTGKVAYTLNDNDLVYASYARGYKGGGYNLDRAGLANPLFGAIPTVTDLQFEPEIVDSFEVGGKFGLFGQKTIFNTTLFYMNFKNFQLITFTGIQFVAANLEKVKSRGIEMETTALVTEGLTVNAGLTYADTQYGKSISNATLAGNQLTNAPEWTLTGAATYEKGITRKLMGFIHFDVRYMSSYNTGSDLDIEKIQEGFAVMNGRVGIGDVDGSWRFELWGKNLLDKDYIQIAFDAPIQGRGTGPGSTQTFNAFLGGPRTIGVTLRRQF